MSCSKRKMRKLEWGTVYVGELPRGCKLCHEGAKMVLFITGLCNRRCWYCPISYERRGRDVIYANEIRVNSIDEAVKVAEEMEAEGTGITGGEPLMVMDRLLMVIRELKRTLGADHHIHLYTNGSLLTKAALRRLKNAGLDEIRIHSMDRNDWMKIVWAKELGITAGFEVPVIPDMEDLYKEMILYLDEVEGDFINLNELEVSETNYMSLRLRGYSAKHCTYTSIEGSEELALRLVEWASTSVSVSVHYCPAIVKDKVQLKRRLLRIAHRRRKPYEKVDEEGLIVRGIVEGSDGLIEILCQELLRRNVREELFQALGGRLAFHPNLADTIVHIVEILGLPLKVYVERRYPVGDLVVEITPLI